MCKPVGGAPIDPVLVGAVERTAKLLADLGHEVEEASPDYDAAATGAGRDPVWRLAAAAALARGRIVTGNGPAAAVLAASQRPFGPNRVTFACPLCPQDPFGRSANMDCTSLVEHVAQHHAGDHRPALCSVCAVMPWGSSAYISRDWAAHVQLRHRFEYATFVDFEEDESAALARVLAASAREGGVDVEVVSDSEEEEEEPPGLREE